MAQHKNEIHGFDSFEGLTEDWLTHVYNPVGALSLNKKTIENLNSLVYNVIFDQLKQLFVGWFNTSCLMNFGCMTLGQGLSTRAN